MAFLIDLALLVAAYLLARDANLPFADPDSWYFVVVAFALVNLILLPSLGVSIGKWLLGLRIIDDRYEPPGLPTAVIRSLFQGAIWVAVIMAAPPIAGNRGADKIDLLLGGVLAFLLVVAVTDWISYLDEPHQRTIHDLAAGTYVVSRSSLVEIGVLPRRTIGALHPSSWPTRRSAAALARGTMAKAFDPASRLRMAISRLAGFLIDLVIVGLGLHAIDWALAGYGHHDARLVAKTVLLVGYFARFVALGATPGTWLSGLRIVSARDGNAPGLARGLRRLLLYSPILGLIFFDSSRMAYTMEVWERLTMVVDLLLLALVLTALGDALWIVLRGKALHDVVAGTLVERTSARRHSRGA